MGDNTPVGILDLALCCLSLVNAVPEKDHPDWTTRMKKLWQLGGIDQGAQCRSLEWE